MAKNNGALELLPPGQGFSLHGPDHGTSRLTLIILSISNATYFYR